MQEVHGFTKETGEIVEVRDGVELLQLAHGEHVFDFTPEQARFLAEQLNQSAHRVETAANGGS